MASAAPVTADAPGLMPSAVAADAAGSAGGTAGTIGARVLRGLQAQLDALPLAAFLVLAAWLSPVSSTSWRLPYVAAALLAIAVHCARHRRGELLDRVHLALACYFVSGAAGVLLDWTWLNEAYGRLEATAMLLWVLPLGLGFTLWSPAGLVGAAAAPRGRVRMASWWLLLLACAAAGWSAMHPGEHVHGAVLPFVVLFVGQSLLRAWALRGAAGTGPRRRP